MIYKEIYKYEQYKRRSRAITRDLETNQKGGWKEKNNDYSTMLLLCKEFPQEESTMIQALESKHAYPGVIRKLLTL